MQQPSGDHGTDGVNPSAPPPYYPPSPYYPPPPYPGSTIPEGCRPTEVRRNVVVRVAPDEGTDKFGVFCAILFFILVVVISLAIYNYYYNQTTVIEAFKLWNRNTMEGAGRTDAGESNLVQGPADTVGFGPLYQNLVHSHYETPVHQDNQHHERSESSQLDQHSMDSYGVDHVYANPSFSAYPEIPPPDYPLDNDGSQYPVRDRRRSSSSSSSSNSKVDHHSTSATRRASSPTIQEASSQPTGLDFHNVPLGLPPFERPRSEDTVTVITVPNDNSYLTYGMYSTIAFVSVIVVILIIWSLVYYGI